MHTDKLLSLSNINYSTINEHNNIQHYKHNYYNNLSSNQENKVKINIIIIIIIILF